MKTDLMTWVATAIGCPLAIVSVCWTLIIYHYHRRQWHSTDFLLATIVVQGIIKQVATFFYTLLTLLQPIEYEQTLCSTLTWIMNSIHVLQAGTLATFILTRLLAIKFPQKYVHAVRRTHLIYHIVSLSILASCIGVAAILAEKKPPVNLFQNLNATFPFLDDKGRRAHCAFLPHELEERYAILSIVIHSFLILSSIVILLLACFSWCVYNKSRDDTSYKQRQLLLTSSSDLSAMSDLSLGSTAQNMGLISSRKENGGSVISITRLLNTENGGVPASRGRNDTLIHELPRHSTSFTNHNNAYNDQRKCSRHDHTYSGNSNVFHPSFSSSNSNPFMLHSTSLHRYKNTSVNNDNHPTNGSNYDEIYDQTYLRSGNYTNGDSCRWTTESSYMSTSTSSTNSRAPCLIRPVHTEGNANVGPSEEPRLAIAVSVLVLCYIFNHIPSLRRTRRSWYLMYSVINHESAISLRFVLRHPVTGRSGGGWWGVGTIVRYTVSEIVNRKPGNGNVPMINVIVNPLIVVTCANPVVQTYEYSIGQLEHCWLSSSEHQGVAQFVSCFGRLFILAFVVSRLDLHVVLLQAYIPALSIVATFLPSLVPLSWPLTLLYLWGGLAEESLLPVILAIFDNNFSGWVASVYSRDHKIFADIAAHNQACRIYSPLMSLFTTPLPKITNNVSCKVLMGNFGYSALLSWTLNHLIINTPPNKNMQSFRLQMVPYSQQWMEGTRSFINTEQEKVQEHQFPT
uniref:G-protein coupled receptors family 1 profile domain-containing protein n=1 Tax=Timema cristinae TaxID=61476 RepID=A0A7R9GSI0_TIMCR|nr:unnamed protein product [Timema cristinae]